MRLLGEDSPVSKLQAKLEPGACSHQACAGTLWMPPLRALPLPLACSGGTESPKTRMGVPSPERAFRASLASTVSCLQVL